MATTVFTGWRNVTPGPCATCGMADDYECDGRGTVYCSCQCCAACGAFDGHTAECTEASDGGDDPPEQGQPEQGQPELEPTLITVLSIDAWADGDDGWAWNQWHKVGTCPLSTCDLEPAAIIRFMIDEGYLQPHAADRCEVDDDQYNMVIVDKETGEPLFALEYGPAVA